MMQVVGNLVTREDDVIVHCTDLVVCRQISENFRSSCKSLEFEGSESSTAAIVSKKRIMAKSGKFLIDFTNEAAPDKASKEALEVYSAKCSAAASNRLIELMQHGCARAAVISQLVDFDLSVPGCVVYYLPGPAPHNMLTLIVAERSEVARKFVPTVDKWTSAECFRLAAICNALRNTYFLHRMPIWDVLRRMKVRHLPSVPYFIPKAKPDSEASADFKYTDGLLIDLGDDGWLEIPRGFEPPVSSRREPRQDRDLPVTEVPGQRIPPLKLNAKKTKPEKGSSVASPPPPPAPSQHMRAKDRSSDELDEDEEEASGSVSGTESGMDDDYGQESLDLGALPE